MSEENVTNVSEEGTHVRYVWPVEVHAQVKAQAALEGVSMGEWVLGAVMAKLDPGAVAGAAPRTVAQVRKQVDEKPWEPRDFSKVKQSGRKEKK